MPMLATPRRHRFQTALLRTRYGEMMTEFFGTAAKWNRAWTGTRCLPHWSVAQLARTQPTDRRHSSCCKCAQDICICSAPCAIRYSVMGVRHKGTFLDSTSLQDLDFGNN